MVKRKRLPRFNAQREIGTIYATLANTDDRVNACALSITELRGDVTRIEAKLGDAMKSIEQNRDWRGTAQNSDMTRTLIMQVDEGYRGRCNALAAWIDSLWKRIHETTAKVEDHTSQLDVQRTLIEAIEAKLGDMRCEDQADTAVAGERIAELHAAETKPNSVWTDAHSKLAQDEGWGLFVVDGGGLVIQRIDDPDDKHLPPLFESDEAAIAFVKRMSTLDGYGGVHRLALTLQQATPARPQVRPSDQTTVVPPATVREMKMEPRPSTADFLGLPTKTEDASGNWNIACGFATDPYCYDRKYAGMSAEQIYDALKKEGLRVREVWVNIYPDTVAGHATQAEADKVAWFDRIGEARCLRFLA